MENANIVLIVLDSVRRDHLSAYGYELETTPFLDSLTPSSVSYQNCFAPSVWTIPSHASLFTGKYVYEHGLYGRELQLAPDFATLAEGLTEKGYETVAITANSLVSPLTELTRGFEHDLQFRDRYIIGRKNPLSRIPLLNRSLAKFRLAWHRDSGATWINRRAQKWVNGRRENRPFFLFVNYMEAHLTYSPPAEFRRLFLDDDEEQRWKRIEQDPLAYILGKSKLTDEDMALLGKLYDAELRYLDSQVANLYEIFETAGLNQNTLWVITSDHGENLGEHGMMDHQFCILDTLAHVPFIVHVPGSARAEQRQIRHLVEQKDLYSWLLDGAEQSSAAYFLANPLPPHEYCLYEYLEPPLANFNTRDLDPGAKAALSRNFRAIRTRRFKLVEVAGCEYQLFDMITDPGEENDVANLFPQVTEELRALLAQHPLNSHDSETRLTDDERKALEEQLNALGYL